MVNDLLMSLSICRQSTRIDAQISKIISRARLLRFRYLSQCPRLSFADVSLLLRKFDSCQLSARPSFVCAICRDCSTFRCSTYCRHTKIDITLQYDNRKSSQAQSPRRDREDKNQSTSSHRICKTIRTPRAICARRGERRRWLNTGC
jgi:hypothetical protein